MSYQLQIEDNEGMEGNKPGTINIPAKDSATITIPVELNFKELGQGLYDLIRKGDELRYDFNLSTTMVSDEHLLEESDITLNATGQLKTVIDAAKEQDKEN
jgi:LEA14-like dessication related protein